MVVQQAGLFNAMELTMNGTQGANFVSVSLSWPCIVKRNIHDIPVVILIGSHLNRTSTSNIFMTWYLPNSIAIHPSPGSRINHPPRLMIHPQSLSTVCDLVTILKFGAGAVGGLSNPYAYLLTRGGSSSSSAIIRLLEWVFISDIFHIMLCLLIHDLNICFWGNVDSLASPLCIGGPVFALDWPMVSCWMGIICP